jgi:hypothetical protein
MMSCKTRIYLLSCVLMLVSHVAPSMTTYISLWLPIHVSKVPLCSSFV